VNLALATVLLVAAVGAGGDGAAGEIPPPAAAVAPAFTVGEDRTGGEIAVSPGTLFAVELESASGGGYTWTLAHLDAAILELVAGEVRPAPAGERPALGAPARQRFLLRALAPGTAALELALARPWKPAEPLRSFRLRVVVAAPPD
jgi:predicted secreted protein